jgi:adenylate cyclase
MLTQSSGESSAKMSGVDESETAGVARRMNAARGLLQNWARPLRVHLSNIIVALLVAISLPLIWLAYDQGTRAALASAEQQMRLLSQQATDLCASVVGDGVAIIEMASVLPSLAAEPPVYLDAKKQFLLKALKGSGHVDGVYLGFPSGAFVQVVNVDTNERWRNAISAPATTRFAMRTILRSPDGTATSTWSFLDEEGGLIEERNTGNVTYDPRRRPWYRAAIGKTWPVPVGPYVSASTHSLTLSLAVTMERGDGVVVGADVLLNTISDLLADQPVSGNAESFVLDRENNLIIHSNKAMMARVLDALSSTPGIGRSQMPTDPVVDAARGLVTAASDRPDQLAQFQVGGQPYLARISSAGFSGLLQGSSIVIAAPLADFTAPSMRVVRKTVAIAGILVLAGVMAAFVVARTISRALVELAEDARQIGDMDFAGRGRKHSWISEVNLLSGALASARDAIRTFALYVPRELVRRIIASGQAEAGRAVRQDVTVLFTDIFDFTTISERHSPEAVIDLLTRYFERMNEVVEKNNGIIVQYLGDSVYAMWNAPQINPRHVTDGCRCALEMKAAIDQLNEANRQNGEPQLVTRFGLHTGIAVVGSVGAEARRQYSAMGDTVNVASRLEGMNKQFGTSILVSEAVVANCEPLFEFRALGAAHAKGREQGIDVFELVGLSVSSPGGPAAPETRPSPHPRVG